MPFVEVVGRHQVITIRMGDRWDTNSRVTMPHHRSLEPLPIILRLVRRLQLSEISLSVVSGPAPLGRSTERARSNSYTVPVLTTTVERDAMYLQRRFLSFLSRCR